MEVFIVGRVEDPTWGFQGVFTTEKRAVAACRDSTYFVGPATLDEELPDTTSEWPNAYYPIAESP